MDPQYLLGGVCFLIIGLVFSIFYKSIGKIAWLGMPSVSEMVTGYDREKRFYNRARFTRFMGIVFACVGIVLILYYFIA